ncbi:Hypp3454 [Branchiostoma lanceolatum]|uniref:Hypp3454 protein n=1 Tax=Branchiostoma lanceolatum TaxID=7740 RepID=A0A8J9ZZU2_BRALA|nr:Hypp3454 [Branchiostoma lanceolatum]
MICRRCEDRAIGWVIQSHQRDRGEPRDQPGSEDAAAAKERSPPGEDRRGDGAAREDPHCRRRHTVPLDRSAERRRVRRCREVGTRRTVPHSHDRTRPPARRTAGSRTVLARRRKGRAVAVGSAAAAFRRWFRTPVGTPVLARRSGGAGAFQAGCRPPAALAGSGSLVGGVAKRLARECAIARRRFPS